IDNPTLVSGDITGEIYEAQSESINGTLLLSDVDSVASIEPSTHIGQYGEFSVKSTGQWTYQLDDSKLTDLHTGDSRTELFQVRIADGSLQTIEITVHGDTDNASPVLSGMSVPTLALASSEDAPISGQMDGAVSVKQFLGGVLDTDGGALGAAIISAQVGTYYSTDEGQTWHDLSDAANDNATLLNGDALIYATAAVDPGNIIGFRAWDSSTAESGTTGIDLTQLDLRGDSSGFSSGVGYIQSTPEALTASEDAGIYTAKSLFGSDSSAFTEGSITASDVTAVDANDDGILDYLMDDGQLWLGFQGSDGISETIVYQKATASAALQGDGSELILELTGDGIADLVATDGHVINIYEGLGDGQFSDQPMSSYLVPDGGDFKRLAISQADLDGDGNAELIAATREGNTPWRILDLHTDGSINDVTEQFAAIAELNNLLPSGDLGKFSLDAGDLNADGLVDFMVTGNDSGNLFLLQQPDGTFTANALDTLIVDENGDPIALGDNILLSRADVTGLGDLDGIVLVQEGVAKGFVFDESLQKFTPMDTNTAAAIEGDTSASAEGTLERIEATGQLSVQDLDGGEAYFEHQVVDGHYGQLTLDNDGQWHYVADTEHAEIVELSVTDTLLDVVEVTSADGTVATVQIVIDGSQVGGSIESLTVENDILADVHFDEPAATVDLSQADSLQTTDGVSVDTTEEVVRFTGTEGEATQTVSDLTPALNYTAEVDIARDGSEPATFEIEVIDEATGNVLATKTVAVDSETPETQSIDFASISQGDVSIKIKDVSTGDVTEAQVHDLAVVIKEENNSELTPLVTAAAGEAFELVVEPPVISGAEAIVELAGVPAGTVISDGVTDIIADGSLVDVSMLHLDAGVPLSIQPPVGATENFFIEAQTTLVGDKGEIISQSKYPVVVNLDGDFSPILMTQDSSVVLEEGSDHQFSMNDFSVAGINTGEPTAITITELPDEGSLTLAGVPVTENQEIVAEDIANLVFTPAEGAVGEGVVDFGFTVTDGGLTSEPSKVSLDIAPSMDTSIQNDVFSDVTFDEPAAAADLTQADSLQT
ncbi:MAG: VCBS domain-containing protein, partial [Cellvibrionales bacterium]|nr:VCBS domain-containing protein [Cellvibrionales bacterium]